MEEIFGDFDADDAFDDGVVLSDDEMDKVVYLQKRYDDITNIHDALERKLAAKLLVEELNGA